MKTLTILLTILLTIYFQTHAFTQENVNTALDTLRIPSEILIDKAVKPDARGQYPYPRPIDSYDAIEVQFREDKKVTGVLYFIALIDPQTGQLKYQQIEKTDFKLINKKQ